MVQYNQSGYQYNEGRYNAVTVTATGDAPLGALVASASATITPGPGPAPSTLAGGGRYPYAKSRNKPKFKGPVVELVELQPSIVKASAGRVRVGASAAAFGAVTFSAEEDDLQVLLML